MKGTKYKEDIVVVRRNVDGIYIPFFVIELKFLIHMELNGCSPHDVNECLLYGKYMIDNYRVNVDSLLCALTDAQTWHVFQYDGSCIQKYYKFRNDNGCFSMHENLHGIIQSKVDEMNKESQ